MNPQLFHFSKKQFQMGFMGTLPAASNHHKVFQFI